MALNKREKKVFENLRKKKGVTVVGYGYKETGGKMTTEKAIVVGVKEKLPLENLSPKDIIPQSALGAPTDVQERGEIFALGVENKERQRPAYPGCSIGHKDITAGTFSALVKVGGVPFLMSNNHVFAAVNRGKKGDEILQPGCYSEDTRVLTREGFKYFNELAEQDEVVTLNAKTGNLEYQKPSKVHRHRYIGPMVSFKGQMYSLLVTPNHNMYCGIHSRRKGKRIARKGQNDWMLRRADEVINYEIELKRDAIWDGKDQKTFKLPQVDGPYNIKNVKEFPIDRWLDFLGWWISEGSLSYNKGYRISIRQIDEKNLEEIARIVADLGYSPYVHKKHSVEFYSKQLFFYLRQFGHAGDKFIPVELKELPPLRLKRLLRTLFKGDGSFVSLNEDVKMKNVGQLRRYFSKSKRLAEDVAEIALKCGFGVSIQRRQDILGVDHWRVGISYRNLTPRVTTRPTLVNYDGYVYCVTVPNHIIFVEHEGKTCWCGNSYDGGTIPADVIATLERYIEIEMIGGSNCPLTNAVAKTFNALARIFDRHSRLEAVRSITNLVDCALAKPVNLADVSDSIFGIGTPAGSILPTVGMEVQKSGRTTGHTKGKITLVNAMANVNMGNNEIAVFEDQFEVDGTGEAFSAGGDSGSLVLNALKQVVGLLFAGSDTKTYCNSIHNVIDKLGLDNF